MTLVPTTAGQCPTCGLPLRSQRVDEPALIRHGGYGATRSTVLDVCSGCGWSLQRERSEVRP